MKVKTPEKPPLELLALYVNHAGQKPVKVQPDNGTVKIGDKSWTINSNSLMRGKLSLVLVEGRGEAIPIWEKGEGPGPEEVDELAHNNILQQIRESSRPKQSQAASWVSLGLTGLLCLLVIGMGFWVHGAIQDAAKQEHIDHYDPATGQPYAVNHPYTGGDSTVVNNGSGGGGSG